MTESPRIDIHATSVVIGAAGAPFGASPEAAVLILGPSGSGKSDTALRLIAMGGKLLSDDRTMLYAKDGVLFAEGHPSLYGQIEVRGAGILKLDACRSAPVCLAVVLGDEKTAVERLPEPARYVPPAGLRIMLPPPLLRLRAFEASIPAKIAAVAAALARRGFLAGAADPLQAPFIP
jgi:HPr kinase/phosphorylase